MSERPARGDSFPAYRPRVLTPAVLVRQGTRRVIIGGGAPVVVQSMTNTPTEEVDATLDQCRRLADAGSELVRLTINTPAAARALVRIRERLDAEGRDLPLVGDFHYNGHRLLADVPECALALAKYRVNPGNVGRGAGRQENFARMVELACRHDKPVRIGVNGGSVDPELLALMMDRNRNSDQPLPSDRVVLEAIVESTLASAREAERLGLPADHIVLSAKVSEVADLIWVYRQLSRQGHWALHLGLTEAGLGSKGVAASAAALAVLLAEGIGDTIRISLTPAPGADRCEEVVVAQQLLQSMGLRHFMPLVTSCPGCGRTSSDMFQLLAQETESFLRRRLPEWRLAHPGSERLRVAVMGCVVNGPGESRQADIGISLPGRGESPVAQIWADGVKIASLKGDDLSVRFQDLIDDYVRRRWPAARES